VWGNILKHCRCILDNYPATISFSVIISPFLDLLFLWLMYCHFGRWQRQSRWGKTFGTTLNTFWIIFRQAFLQNTLLASISPFLDTLFLWLIYCHFGRCQRQSECRETFGTTPDAFWIIFQQAFLQNTFLATISPFLDTLFLWLMYCILGSAKGNLSVGQHSEPLPPHFGECSGKHIYKIHFQQQFHHFLMHYFFW